VERSAHALHWWLFTDELLGGNQETRRPLMMTIETLSLAQLHTVTGGADNPNGIKTKDVVEAGGRAAEAVLTGGTSLLGNLGTAYDRATRSDRVGNGFWDRAADSFTGLFGIDPLKK
jgi:hypothetical protein